MTRPLIGFLSDFGLLDPYAGTVKAVMLGICPELTIVDVSHDVAPQSIAQAVFLAQQAWSYFPDGSVQLVVVDPGVGTARAPIALRTPAGIFVGPDNGVLSAALPDELRRQASGGASGAAVRLRAPAAVEARRIENTRVLLPEPSATFHGRDVFGPAAAHLAAGLPFAEIGPPVEEIEVLPAFQARLEAGRVAGRVVHVDRFGNLITTVRRADLPVGAQAVEIMGERAPLTRTYGEGKGLVALIGSSGYLEVAVVNGNAASRLGAGIGAAVEVLVG